MFTRRDFHKRFLATGAVALGTESASPRARSLSSGPDESPAANESPTGQVSNAPQNMDRWATRITKSVEENDQWEPWERMVQAGMKPDLLIKGGTVIDPAQKLHAPLDVAVKDGRIAAVAENIPPDGSSRVISAKGWIVTPGFIDLHIHCYDGVTFGVNADRYCLTRGVTTVVDAGSTGYLGIHRFIRDVVNTSATRVYAMVHICPMGDTTTLEHLMDDLKNVNPHLAAMAAERSRPAVVGIKVHLSTVYSSHPKDMEQEFLKRALEAAEESHLPLMAHVDQTYYPLAVTLKQLRRGDIRTHCFSQWPIDSPLDAKGRIIPEMREARDRGVLFDVAEGMRHFSFDVVEKCMEQGFLPDTISTDVNKLSATRHMYDLPTEVSKFLAVGMNLDKAIECVTVNPARAFDFGVDIGTLRPGSEADIGIFDLREGSFEFRDINGATRVGKHRLVSKAVICRGELYVNEI